MSMTVVVAAGQTSRQPSNRRACAVTSTSIVPPILAPVHHALVGRHDPRLQLRGEPWPARPCKAGAPGQSAEWLAGVAVVPDCGLVDGQEVERVIIMDPHRQRAGLEQPVPLLALAEGALRPGAVTVAGHAGGRPGPASAGSGKL